MTTVPPGFNQRNARPPPDAMPGNGTCHSWAATFVLSPASTESDANNYANKSVHHLATVPTASRNSAPDYRIKDQLLMKSRHSPAQNRRALFPTRHGVDIVVQVPLSRLLPPTDDSYRRPVRSDDRYVFSSLWGTGFQNDVITFIGNPK